MPERKNSLVDYRPPAVPDLVWVEPQFALGSRPYDHQRRAIVQLGIRVVVALHESAPGDRQAWQVLGVRLISIPTPDWVEIPTANFDGAVAAIDDSLNAGRPVLLHCLAGLNRAPTVAAAALCRRHGMDVPSALAAIRRVRPAAKPTPEQETSLWRWHVLRL